VFMYVCIQRSNELIYSATYIHVFIYFHTHTQDIAALKGSAEGASSSRGSSAAAVKPVGGHESGGMPGADYTQASRATAQGDKSGEQGGAKVSGNSMASKSGVNTGGKSGVNTGGKSGVNTGGKSGVNTGGKSGVNTGGKQAENLKNSGSYVDSGKPRSIITDSQQQHPGTSGQHDAASSRPGDKEGVRAGTASSIHGDRRGNIGTPLSVGLADSLEVPPLADSNGAHADKTPRLYSAKSHERLNSGGTPTSGGDTGTSSPARGVRFKGNFVRGRAGKKVRCANLFLCSFACGMFRSRNWNACLYVCWYACMCRF
jgi:hypothetical protein